MRFTKTGRKVKCKKCGKSEICYKDTWKKVNICSDCLEEYKESRINCTVCKKSFKRVNEYFVEDSKWKTKNFCCESCYNEYELEENEKEKMIEWLKEQYKTDTLPSRIYMQMEDFKTKKKISYKWTFATLRYMVNIKDQGLQEGTIGLVPYMVDECKEYVVKLNKIRKNAQDSERHRAKFTDNIVIIREIDINKERDRAMNKKMISESDLEGVMTW